MTARINYTIRRTLTDREREIVTMLAAGMTHQELGAKLGLSRQTMKNRVRYIYDMVGVDGSTALVTWALLTDNIDRDAVAQLLAARYPQALGEDGNHAADTRK